MNIEVKCSMGEELVRSYLRSKLSAILHEAEGGPSSASWIISRFRSIERRIISMSENSVSIDIDLLYDLIDQLSECRVVASKSNNGFHWFRVFWLMKNMRRRLVETEKKLLEADPKSSTSTIPASNNGWFRVRKMRRGLVEMEKRPPPAVDDPKSCTIISNYRVQQTYPTQDPTLIIGFESEAQEIEAWLLENDRVGIVGRCGSGKTALAQKVFASSRIQAEFSPRIWVCLSNMLLSESKPDPRARVLKYILEEMGHEVVSDYSVDKLVEKLHRGLMGRRYLIVLDDVWRMDEWYPSVLLAHGLPRGSSGGAVIATGRRENVIRGMVGDHDHVILMEPLSQETCLGIFSDVVRRQHQADARMPNCLLQDIINNFHGLPLAANALATTIPRLFWIPARELYIVWGDDTRYWRWISPTPPEVEEVAELVEVCWLEIRGSVELKKLMLPYTSYSAYLVFKLNKDCIGLNKAMAQVGFGRRGERIPLTEDGEGCSCVFIDTINTHDEKEWGKEWMEIKLGEFSNHPGGGDDETMEAILFDVQNDYWKSGLVVKGIHFRPNY